MYTHENKYVSAGTPVQQAKAALIMLHGRGGTAANIINLTNEFNLKDVAIYAPQATHNSWYPYSFMAPEKDNQPALDSALENITGLVKHIEEQGITADRIYFSGFSQGACLTLEYVGRDAKRYGGVVAFTGGLIGEELISNRYKGDFNKTPVLISTSKPDPHVPLNRVEESVGILKALNADVTLNVYQGKPHSISPAEIKAANSLIFNSVSVVL